jgi:hypothetical protein
VFNVLPEHRSEVAELGLKLAAILHAAATTTIRASRKLQMQFALPPSTKKLTMSIVTIIRKRQHAEARLGQQALAPFNYGHYAPIERKYRSYYQTAPRYEVDGLKATVTATDI